jgi:Family of unknown function (DUF5995)
MDMPAVSTEKFLAIVDRVPTTIPEVIAQQSDLQDLLERAAPAEPVTGLAYFNYLYKIITQTVLDALNGGRFRRPEFLAMLDVEFAKRYFAALSAAAREPGAAPRAWAVLLDRAYEKEITAMQFAVAGVNAHINFDLAFSVVSTFVNLGTGFDEGCRADYQYVNDIFHDRIPDLKEHLENAFWAKVDDLGGQWDDRLEDYAVVISRELAWHSARRVWPDRDSPVAMERESRRMDRFAAIIGRGLLVRL